MSKAKLKRDIIKASHATAHHYTKTTKAALDRAIKAAKGSLTDKEIEQAIDEGYYV